jgi:CRP/FNR family transcriptional regulator, anaerobic regulatory protein
MELAMFDVLDIAPKAEVAEHCAEAGRCRSVCSGCKVRLFAVCAALDDKEIKALEKRAQQKTFLARQPVIFAGDQAESVFTLTSGFLRLQRDLYDGRRQIIGFAAPGDFVGLSLSPHYAYSGDALTDMTVCAFNRVEFAEFAHTTPNLIERLHQFVSHELSLAQEHMVLLGRRRAEERVALFLINWRKKMNRIFGSSATLPLPMGRQDIADHLGLTIETVSRIIARMGREKIILDVPGGVCVLDEIKLMQLVPL